MNMMNFPASAPQPGLSMPGGIPGVGGGFDPTMAPSFGGGLDPGLGLGGLGGFGMLPPGALEQPEEKFMVEVQSDQSLILRRQNPDGTPGPVVKVLPPIKPTKPPQ